MTVGAAAGLVAGLVLMDATGRELTFGQGVLLGVTTDKAEYGRGDSITINIVNTGTLPINTDESWGLRISGLAGNLIYRMPPVNGTLEPGASQIVLWNQTRSDGSMVLEGLYRISVHGTGPAGQHADDHVTITILK